MPLGILIFGWTVQFHVYGIVPIIGISIIRFGFIILLLASSSYLLNAFDIYAASALAASVVWRNIIAALLSLASPPLYTKLD